MLHLVKNSGPVRVTTATRQADERETKGRTALRLVGTATSSPAKKGARHPAAEGMVSAAPASAENLKSRAHELILDYVADGISVRDRIEIAEAENYRLFVESSIWLSHMGIILGCGGESLGLDYAVFATVVEPKELFRYFPKLKKPATALNLDLAGLALY